MIRALALFVALLSGSSTAAASTAGTARWRARAARITIVRDDWGVTHVAGRVARCASGALRPV